METHKFRGLVFGAIAALVLGFAASGPAVAETFTLTNNGGNGFFNPVPDGVDLFGADNGPSSGLNNRTIYSATASSARSDTINWTYTTHDLRGSSFDKAGVVVNGVFTQLSLDTLLFGQSNSGVFTFNLVANDVYGAWVSSSDSENGRGEILINGSATPLPAALPLFAGGLGVIGLLARRRKQKYSAAAV